MKRVRYVADKQRVGHEFPSGDAADRPHKRVLPHKSVRSTNDIVSHRVEYSVYYFEVDKRRVIHYYEKRTFARFIAIGEFVSEIRVRQIFF